MSLVLGGFKIFKGIGKGRYGFLNGGEVRFL